jgi:hypothetical protein
VVSVVRVTVVISSRRHGISVGDALMADGRVARFKVIARDPLTVRALGADAQPGDAEAIAAYLAGQGRET